MAQKPPRLPPPQEASRTDWTPGRVVRAEAGDVVVNPTGRAATPPPLDRRLIAPLRPAARAELMSPEDRAKFQQEQSNESAKANRPSAEKQLSDWIIDTAWWGFQKLPGVSAALGIDLGELFNNVSTAATSEDPLRESAKLAGREIGKGVGTTVSNWVGRRLNRGKKGDEGSSDDELEGGGNDAVAIGTSMVTTGQDAEGESPEAKPDLATSIRERIVGKLTDLVVDKTTAYGEHVAETLVDSSRDPDAPLRGARDEHGRFRALTAKERGINRLRRDDANWFRRASFTLGNETGQVVRRGLELVGLPAPSEGTVAAVAYLSSGLPYAGGVSTVTNPGEAFREAGKLREQINEGARPGEVAAILREQLAAQREANQIMRNAGARPVSSQAYAE